MSETETVVPEEFPLHFGGLLFPGMDQADFTGPFEVLSCVRNGTFHLLAKTMDPVRDAHGLVLAPGETIAECPRLDLLLVPGGGGVNALMEDEQTLAFVRREATTAKLVLSVCTGALVCGAAGLLRGRKATTHWASHHLLHYFGATAVNQRIVRDGNLITCAGVTAGLDGALLAVSVLRGAAAAQRIQLYLEYAPAPPFGAGTPESAPAEIVAAQRAALRGLLEERRTIVNRVKERLAQSS